MQHLKSEQPMNSPRAISSDLVNPKDMLKEYRAWQRKVAKYEVGSKSEEYGFPLARLLAKRQDRTSEQNQRVLNLALFGYAKAGKSAAISLLVNAVQNRKSIELVTRMMANFLQNYSFLEKLT